MYSRIIIIIIIQDNAFKNDCPETIRSNSKTENPNVWGCKNNINLKSGAEYQWTVDRDAWNATSQEETGCFTKNKQTKQQPIVLNNVHICPLLLLISHSHVHFYSLHIPMYTSIHFTFLCTLLFTSRFCGGSMHPDS